ncbi:MAG: nucleotide sugar dehydrogenase, partial [Minisyncoccia bacterium]
MKKVIDKTEAISVIGLGKLGACYAAFYASHGYKIFGFDTDAKRRAMLAKGHATVFEEPKLQDYFKKAKGNFHAARSMKEAVMKSSVSFIIVPTPSKKDGLFSVDAVRAVVKDIGAALKAKKSYHTVVLVSTVLPGDSRELVIPVLEKASGKKCGVDFGYVYSPSLIAIGDILSNLEKPDLLFVGAYDSRSERVLSDIYRHVYGKGVNVRPMSIESGELAKIALNSYVTTKISFANTLAAIADRLPHAHVDEVTGALGSDRRIGNAYLRAGLGFGGPCFPRDNRAFGAMAKRRGVQAPIPVATDAVNDVVTERMIALILKHAGKKPATVGFLGVSYKPRTTMTEDSQALEIAKAVQAKGHRLVIHEPIHTGMAEQALGSKHHYASGLEELLEKSHVVFVSNNDVAFVDLPDLISAESQLHTIVD